VQRGEQWGAHLTRARIARLAEALNGHPGIVDAGLQFGDELIGIDSRQKAAIDGGFAGRRNDIGLERSADSEASVVSDIVLPSMARMNLLSASSLSSERRMVSTTIRLPAAR